MDNVLNSVDIIGGADGPTSIFLAGEITTGTMIASIIIGLLLCFFGLKVVKILVTLIGFVIGAGVGITIVEQTGLTGMINLLVIFGCGIVLAAVAFFVYRAGVFLMAFSIVGGVIMLMIDVSVNIQLIAALAITLVLSILAVIFVEPVIIIITSLTGGIAAGLNIASVAGLTENPFIGIGISAALTIAGLLVQFVMHSRKVGKKEKDHFEEFKESNSMESEVEKARMLLDDDEDEDMLDDERSSANKAFDDIEIINNLDDIDDIEE